MVNCSRDKTNKTNFGEKLSNSKGTRQIHVILYAKGGLRGAPTSTDRLPIEDILAVEHNVIPLDGADVFQQGSIDSIGDRVAFAVGIDPVDALVLDSADARTETQAQNGEGGEVDLGIAVGVGVMLFDLELALVVK